MDTRKRDRTRLIYYLRVFNADTGRVLGHLIDLARLFEDLEDLQTAASLYLHGLEHMVFLH